MLTIALGLLAAATRRRYLRLGSAYRPTDGRGNAELIAARDEVTNCYSYIHGLPWGGRANPGDAAHRLRCGDSRFGAFKWTPRRLRQAMAEDGSTRATLRSLWAPTAGHTLVAGYVTTDRTEYHVARLDAGPHGPVWRDKPGSFPVRDLGSLPTSMRLGPHRYRLVTLRWIDATNDPVRTDHARQLRVDVSDLPYR